MYRYASPRAAVLTHLFTDLLQDSLNELAYDAELAGISYPVGSTKYGVDFTAYGYSEKLPSFLLEVVERMLTLQVDPQRFELAKAGGGLTSAFT